MPAAILPRLETLAAQVGQEIMRLHDTGVTAKTKPDGSPVTEVDQMAEDIIVSLLNQLTPEVPVVAEERYSNSKGFRPDVSAGRFWLVDALDGTREFLASGRDFTVNIGLIENNMPLLGVIHHPADQLTYVAAGPGTAEKIYPNGQRTAITARRPDSGLRLVSSKSFGSEIQLAKFLAGREIREHRRRASSIKFCEVAEGRADLYPRFGPSCEWDTAAGHAIVTGAGGSVTTSVGFPLLYGKTDFLNSDFVVRGL